MSAYDVSYMFHSMRDVFLQMWESSPALLLVIGGVLSTVVYYSFKH